MPEGGYGYYDFAESLMGGGSPGAYPQPASYSFDAPGGAAESAQAEPWYSRAGSAPPYEPEPEAAPWYSRAGSAVGDAASNVGSAISRDVQRDPLRSLATMLGLGVQGFGIANQVRTANMAARAEKRQEQAQKSADAAAAPAVDFGRTQLAAASAGKLPAAMEASLEEWKMKAKADMRSKYAGMGQGNSTSLQSEEQKIDLMAESIRAQLLGGVSSQGLDALRIGASAGTAGAAAAGQQQAALTNLLAAADQQLARLTASQAQ